MSFQQLKEPTRKVMEKVTAEHLAREAESYQRRLKYTQAELDRLRHLIVGDWRAERDAKDRQQREARNRETFKR